MNSTNSELTSNDTLNERPLPLTTHPLQSQPFYTITQNSNSRNNMPNYIIETLPPNPSVSQTLPIRSSSTIINKFLDINKEERILNHKNSFSNSIHTSISDFSQHSSNLSLLSTDEYNTNINVAIDQFINLSMVSPVPFKPKDIREKVSQGFLRKPNKLKLKKDEKLNRENSIYFDTDTSLKIQQIPKKRVLVEEGFYYPDVTNVNDKNHQMNNYMKQDVSIKEKIGQLANIPFGAKMFCGGVLFFPLFYVGSFYKIQPGDRNELQWRGYNRVLACFVTVVITVAIVLLVHGLTAI
ncbi:hypothetical protein K502DRAFT_330733 [Neoconidiobolus thromboides FSU 785]|nr:hypothetical protein K502DRAFT_330733 [Neoconidiobolus thromboides FSU 785]